MLEREGGNEELFPGPPDIAGMRRVIFSAEKEEVIHGKKNSYNCDKPGVNRIRAFELFLLEGGGSEEI